MDDTITDSSEAEAEQNTTTTDDTTAEESAQASEQSVPLAALEAERKKRQRLEAQIAEIEATRAEAERRAAEERGEYQRLYEEAQPRLERLKALEAREEARIQAVNERNSARVESLPEHLRELVPPGMEPDALAAWLDRAAAAAQTRAPAGTVANGGRRGGLTSEDRDWMIKNGFDPANDAEWYLSRMKPKLQK